MSSVEKIMTLADEYANAISVKCGIKFILEQRQALEEELKKLFTPLDDKNVTDAYLETPGLDDHLDAFKTGARYAETQHGIGVKR